MPAVAKWAQKFNLIMQVSLNDERRRSTDRLKPGPVFKQPVTFHYAIQNHTTRMQKLTKAFEVYKLMALTLVCVVAGIIIGLICRPRARKWNERLFMYIELPGELYLRFLKLMIIPLLVSNVIISFGTIQGKVSSRLGKVAGFLYLMGNVIAITLAIIVAVIIKPGCSSRPLDMTSHDAGSVSDGYNKLANHHYFHQYHDSIARYREYHPMYYHTSHDDVEDGDERARLVRQRLVSSLALITSQSLNSNSAAKQSDGSVKVVEQNQLQQPGLMGSSSGGALIELEEQRESANMSSRDLDDELAQLVKSIERSSNTSMSLNRIDLSTRLPVDAILDVLRNLIPDSVIGAALQQSRTRLFTPKELKIGRDGNIDPPPHSWQMGHEVVQQANIVGLLAVSVLTGVVLSHMGEASKPLLELCSCIGELSLRVGMKAIHMAPICIMFLLIGQIARASDLSLIAGELIMYVVTVLLALLVHGFIILPAIYYLVTKKSPLKFFKGLVQALVAAFATSSSSATMALMLNCLSEMDINMIIVRAFGPLGSVFSMNGTSIFEAVAVIFIAQTLAIRLPTTSLLLIGLCSAIASLSTSGIPSSGMMTMVIVLNAINLPVLELSLIYIVDFIIDRFRTVVNVWSGAIVCGLIDHICPEELFEEEMKPEKYQEMVKYRGSRTSLTSRKMSQLSEEVKPQVISVTITPPPVESSNI